MGLKIGDNELWKIIKETHDATLCNKTYIKENSIKLKIIDGRLTRLEKCAGTLPHDAKYWSKLVGKFSAMVVAVTAAVIAVIEAMKIK